MKKRIISLLLALVLVFTLLPAALAVSSYNIAGTSWYGQYTGLYYEPGSTVGVPMERYMNMTIEDCDSRGRFTGLARVTTLTGQGRDGDWITYEFSGTFNQTTYDFHMQGTKKLGSSSTDWKFAEFDGMLTQTGTGEWVIDGMVGNSLYDYDEPRYFSFGLVSAWAKDEITEANQAGLIPSTLKDADMSRRITRAEFAAVSVKLYETLTGKTAKTGSVPFTDISGHTNKNDIAKAYKLGIAVGVSDTRFDPNTDIPREQLATMLCRTIKKYRFDGWTIETDDQYFLDTEGVRKFADDAQISGWAKPSVYYMVKQGIVSGVGNNCFAPKNITSAQSAQGYATATREQAIAMSLRIYKLYDARS